MNTSTFCLFQQPEYEKDLNRKEQEKLRGKVSILSEEDKAMIYNKGIRKLAVAIAGPVPLAHLSI